MTPHKQFMNWDPEASQTRPGSCIPTFGSVSVLLILLAMSQQAKQEAGEKLMERLKNVLQKCEEAQTTLRLCSGSISRVGTESVEQSQSTAKKLMFRLIALLKNGENE